MPTSAPVVGRFGRAYFEVLDLPVPEDYRVSVWDYMIAR